jgi:hypothetical protein
VSEQSNGAKLEGSLAGQSYSLQTRDIIPVLLIVLGGVCGYLLYLAVDRRLEHLREVQVHILKALETHQTTLVQDTRQMYDFHVNQVNYLRKIMLIHDANQHRTPDDRLPLDVEGEPQPKSPLR